MNAGVCLVGVMLGRGLKRAGWRWGEDSAVTGVGVEGVAVDAIGGLFGGEEEDGACVGCCEGGLGCEGNVILVHTFMMNVFRSDSEMVGALVTYGRGPWYGTLREQSQSGS